MSKKEHVNRRDFLRTISLSGAGLYLVGCTQKPKQPLPTPLAEVEKQATSVSGQETAKETSPTDEKPSYGDVYISVIRGEDPGEMARRAVAALGGIERFVSSGANVIIKPNICTDYYSYEYGATTNPEVVAALVSLCLGAGARRVRVMDNPFGGTAKSAYQKSGIKGAVSAVGGEMEVMNSNKFRSNEIPDGVDIKDWKFYQDILDADVVINVPIAKHHGTTGLTLGCKNMMGTILNRGQIHSNIDQRIADLVSRVRPALTVVDGVRTLMHNGPTGGNLNDVKMSNTVIASADVVAADSYAATLFDKTGSDIGYIRAAANMGLGTLDLGFIKIEELSL
ncbi:MAG: DUF362 domain-containing protein [Pelolinea sp.]|nr:DUF362 domain-containing protein [Pelolinea sp.]